MGVVYTGQRAFGGGGGGGEGSGGSGDGEIGGDEGESYTFAVCCSVMCSMW